ncbi:MAG TPA: histidine phosphatase family protein [Mycobacteriales bacterium]|nr:histidine phosphatase family protein [Mycobacteriales bacterium]
MTDAPDLVVWRHGRTEWNDTGRFQGQADVPLDDVGVAQSRAAAVRLAALRPARVVSSDLLRASATAGALGLPVTLDPRLREVHVGEWSGLTRDEVASRFPRTYAAWLAGEDVRREGGETLAEVAARAVSCVTEALGDGGPLVVVTHGGTGRALVLALLGLPAEARAAFTVLGNARWATLARQGERWRLSGYNLGADPANDAPATEPVL